MTVKPAVGADGAANPSLGAVSLGGAWRLSGLLFIVGSLTTIPGTLLLEGSIELWKYSLSMIAVIAGVACLMFPWWRFDERWLAVNPVVATVLITLTVGLVHYIFTYLYFLVALFVALVYPRPRQMAPFLVLLVAALLVPLLYDEPVRETLLWGFAVAPGLLLTALVVGRLTAGLEASREAYRQLSAEDGLTGVGNYRSLIERLREETARHDRRHREFAVLTLDLDNFKTVNDTQGHLVGDLILAIVGSTIDIKVRKEDTVFRQGGDEFSVIAPETDRKQAWRLAERIEGSLVRISMGEVRLSASMGCSVFPHDGRDPGELLDAADGDLRRRRRNDAIVPGAQPASWGTGD